MPQVRFHWKVTCKYKCLQHWTLIPQLVDLKQENWWPRPSGWGSLSPTIHSIKRTASSQTRSTTTWWWSVTGSPKATSSAQSSLETQSTRLNEQRFRTETFKKKKRPNVWFRISVVKCVWGLVLKQTHLHYIHVYLYCIRFVWLQTYFNRVKRWKTCVIEIRCVFIFLWKFSVRM